LPFSPGVYAFYGRNNNVLYVGKSKSLSSRVSWYFQSRSDLIPKVKLFVSQISKILITETKTEFEALLVEARCIRELKPKYNSRLTDDRSPLYIVVTDEKFPRVVTARKTDLGGYEARSVYGPFLSGETVGRILKIARRIFPYCNQKKQKRGRVCFYRHLGLCPGVCAGEISGRRYLAIIKKLEQFLAGDFAGLKVKLEKEMKRAAKKQDFEKAAEDRDAAAALGSLSLAGENEEDMGLTGIERVKALVKLLTKLELFQKTQKTLNAGYPRKTRKSDSQILRPSDSPKLRYSGSLSVLSFPTNSFRIEGFDVSNLGGRLATAAMAVFTGGVKDIKEYRHFRIRETWTPDDPRMVAEAVRRRRLHPEWGKPDLILIDGGKPQMRALLQNSAEFKNMRVIGLAKSPDRLIIPTETGFKTAEVSSRNPGFQLLQQVRDEAHRFSRRLHLKLRKKAMVG